MGPVAYGMGGPCIAAGTHKRTSFFLFNKCLVLPLADKKEKNQRVLEVEKL
jgi:hypothetical protein